MPIKRLGGTNERIFNTYISTDASGNDRLRISLVPGTTAQVASLLSKRMHKLNRNAVKKLHRVTHATYDEMIQLLSDANVLTDKLSRLFEQVYNSCNICASTGRPNDKKKISVAHVNEALNIAIAAEFLVARIRIERYHNVNIIDMETNYGKRSIVPKHGADNMRENPETLRRYPHGAPSSFCEFPGFKILTVKCTLDA